jgi:hypothetical protein
LDAKILFQKLLLLNNLISHYSNNFLLFEKSNFFKTRHCIKLHPFIGGRDPTLQLRRGDPGPGPGKGNLAAVGSSG